MKKTITKAVAALLLILLAVIPVLTACNFGNNGSQGGENGSIKISYYKGGTGGEWIETIAAEFTKDTGIAVELDPDNSITVNARTQLQAGRDLSDIMFIQYTNWHEYVQQGWVEPMDDIYDGTFVATYGDTTITSAYNVAGSVSKIYTNSGKTENVTLYDMLVDDFNDYGKMSKTVNDEEHFWVMPWNSPCTSLVYNVDILKAAGWDNPPATEAELKQCIIDIQTKTGAVAFAWGGMEMKYWDFVTLTWWAQYEGVEKQHSFYDFESPEVFKQKGREEALGLWKELIVGADGSYINSIDKPMGRDHLNAEQQFAMGKAAFTISGTWLENEISDYISDDFNYKMMSVPMIDGAAATNSVLNTEAGSFACIPAGHDPEQVKKAKAFLAYMNRPEMIEKYTEVSGALRPFNYYPSNIPNISEYSKSVYKLYETSDRMWRYSDSPIFTYAGVSEWPYYGSTSLYGNMSGDENKSPADVCEVMYNYALKNWNTWKKTAGEE